MWQFPEWDYLDFHCQNQRWKSNQSSTSLGHLAWGLKSGLSAKTWHSTRLVSSQAHPSPPPLCPLLPSLCPLSPSPAPPPNLASDSSFTWNGAETTNTADSEVGANVSYVMFVTPRGGHKGLAPAKSAVWIVLSGLRSALLQFS